jgi:hypothetical protein
MPLTVRKRGDKYRVVETDTGNIAKNAAGTAIDGGGTTSKARATKQMQAVNIAQARKRGAKIPKAKFE